MKSARPVFPFLLLAFVALVFLSSCNEVRPELKARMQELLERENAYLKEDFVLACQKEQSEIQDQIKGGNHKYEYLNNEFALIQAEINSSEASFDRMQAAIKAGEEIRDSINLLVTKWDGIKKGFCARFINDWNRCLELNCDSSVEKTLAEVDHRFSTHNESTLALELEMQRSNILRDAINMAKHLRSLTIPMCEWRFDTLVLHDYAIENNVVAGEDAKIGLMVYQEVLDIKPEFEGSGKITFDQFGSQAILHVKTSESMIPEGQNEAFVPYHAKAKVSKADGSMSELNLAGKIKIRRPCPTPQGAGF